MAHHDTHEPKKPEHSGAAITTLKIQPYEHGDIPMTSTAISAEGWIDPVFSNAGDNVSPPLAWSGVLEAQSYVLIVEDPDAPREKPMLHWLMWNIPGGLTALPPNVEKALHPSGLQGVVQGENGLGEHGWTGMAPPLGHGVHHYHFQLFALNKMLDFGPNTQLEELINALRGNTIAKGDLVGLFETPDLNSPPT